MIITRKLFFYFFIALQPLFANETSHNSLSNIEVSLWIAIAALSMITIASIVISSKQIKKLKKKYESQNKILQEEDKILSEMSQDIHKIAQGNIEVAKKISEYIYFFYFCSEFANVFRSENKLLSITTDIIEFLRIKSKKTTVVNEKFKLSNLLNDVTGTLKSSIKDAEFSLIYDIKNNIPNNLYGDTLNLSKIITNIILYTINKGATSITVKISKNNIFNQNDQLIFEISSNLILNVQDSQNIFNSKFNEKTQSYESLGLFVANELSELMRGELIARNNKSGEVEFLFNIPFEEDLRTKENPHKIQSKKFLILDTSMQEAQISKNIITELGHQAKINVADNFDVDFPNFENYDAVIVQEELINKKMLEKARLKNLKIISTSNIFTNKQQNNLKENTDFQLVKPLIAKQISAAILNLFSENQSTHELETHQEKTQPILVYKQDFKATPNVDLNDFVKFRTTKVLLVEDNLINQKVFIGILSKAAIEIRVANDGQEALDVLNKDQSFGLIFMDINMPIMDGYTASKKIRQDERFDQIPIVALTALTSAAEVDKMFACHMNGFLPKPLKKEQLYTVFSKFIKNTVQDRRSQARPKTKSPILDGLNTQMGIMNANSNEVFYKEILSEFQDAYGQSGDIFQKLVDDFRYEQLKLLCIDIKGLAGSIGAKGMQDLVTEILQMLVYKRYEMIPTYAEAYRNELNKINTAINTYLS